MKIINFIHNNMISRNGMSLVGQTVVRSGDWTAGVLLWLCPH